MQANGNAIELVWNCLTIESGSCVSNNKQLRLSTEHNARVSIIAPGCGSVNLSQFARLPLRFGYYYGEGRGGSLTTLK